jgi:hypothetical protein
MKKLLKAVAAGTITFLAGVNLGHAQATADGIGKIIPVHLYACNYNDGKDASDMNRAIERWNRFMDEQGIDSYAAWTLVPYHYAGEPSADIMWLGAYRDGNAMGQARTYGLPKVRKWRKNSPKWQPVPHISVSRRPCTKHRRTAMRRARGLSICPIAR